MRTRFCCALPDSKTLCRAHSHVTPNDSLLLLRSWIGRKRQAFSSQSCVCEPLDLQTPCQQHRGTQRAWIRSGQEREWCDQPRFFLHFLQSAEKEDFVAAWQERSGNEKSWNISLNAEGVQGPLNQRGDLKEAKQECKRLYDEHTAITGDGNKHVPPKQQVRQWLDQQFEGLEEYDYRLEARTGWRSHWQPSSDWESTWSWDSWQTSSWTEQ